MSDALPSSSGNAVLAQRVAAIEDLLGLMQQQLAEVLNENRCLRNLNNAASTIPTAVHAPTSPVQRNVNIGTSQGPSKELIAHEGSLLPYDGRTVWEEYEVHLAVTAQTNNWNEDIKGRRLAQALRGPALTVLVDLEPDERIMYFPLARALAERFGQARLVPGYQLQLENRLQNPNEKLTDLAAEIDFLVRRAYPEESRAYRNRLAVKSFIKALHNRDLARLLTLGKPTTVQDALTTALQLEAVGTPSIKQKESTGNIRCWACNDQGHMRSQCPRGPNSRQQGNE